MRRRVRARQVELANSAVVWCPRCDTQVELHWIDGIRPLIRMQGICPGCSVVSWMAWREPDLSRFRCYTLRDSPHLVRTRGVVIDRSAEVWEFAPADAHDTAATELCWPLDSLPV